MASRPSLDVWLYDTLIGSLAEPSFGRLRFEFSQQAERRFRPGAAVLSASMPVNSNRRPRGDVVRAFFDGLLPEGAPRDRLSERFSVRRGDGFGLLAAIGRDCAGAVVLQPAGEPPPGSGGAVEALVEGDLERLVSGLGERPLGADQEVRVSLPGVQDKLLLAKTVDGAWGRPLGGAPTTHILKPQDMRLDSYAASEAFCLRLATRLGLTDVEAEVIEVASRPVVVISRYDRKPTPAGVMRIHQEDACQALGVDCSDRPDRKYEGRGGPSLRSFAAVLADYAPPQDRSRLLALTAFNVTIGNADAHAKNLSILHLPDGATALAPAYDLTPTAFYKDIPTPDGPKDLSDKLGMWVNAKRVIHEVTADDLVEEGTSWGLSGSEAHRVVSATLDRIRGEIDVVAREEPIPERILDFIGTRADRLSGGRPAG